MPFGSLRHLRDILPDVHSFKLDLINYGVSDIACLGQRCGQTTCPEDSAPIRYELTSPPCGPRVEQHPTLWKLSDRYRNSLLDRSGVPTASDDHRYHRARKNLYLFGSFAPSNGDERIKKPRPQAPHNRLSLWIPKSDVKLKALSAPFIGHDP